jgi:hypothetical protein
MVHQTRVQVRNTEYTERMDRRFMKNMGLVALGIVIGSALMYYIDYTISYQIFEYILKQCPQLRI